MHHGFYIDRVFGVIIEARAEPAEEGPNLHAVVKVFAVEFEVFLFVAHPNAPIKRFIMVANRNMNHAAHKIITSLDDTEIVREQAVRVLLVFGGPLESRRRTSKRQTTSV